MTPEEFEQWLDTQAKEFKSISDVYPDSGVGKTMKVVYESISNTFKVVAAKYKSILPPPTRDEGFDKSATWR